MHRPWRSNVHIDRNPRLALDLLRRRRHGQLQHAASPLPNVVRLADGVGGPQGLAVDEDAGNASVDDDVPAGSQGGNIEGDGPNVDEHDFSSESRQMNWFKIIATELRSQVGKPLE